MNPTDRNPALRRVALYGPFGWGNLGDAAIQDAMLHNARRRRPDLRFVAVSLNPENTEEIHGIEAIPILRSWRRRRRPAAGGPGVDPARPAAGTAAPAGPREALKAALRSNPVGASVLRTAVATLAPLRAAVAELRFLARSTRELRDVDLFVFSGGGQLADFWGGPWYHPFCMLKFAVCARLAGAQVRVASVGAGPIRHRLTAWFLRATLRLSHARSYRDEESRELLADWGFPRRDPVVADLAFSHPAAERASLAPSERGETPVVGVSPMSYCHPTPGAWPSQDHPRYARYFGVLEEFCGGLLAEGRPLALFTSQIRNDCYCYDELLQALRARFGDGPGVRLDAESTTGVAHLLEQISRCDVVITSRLHGVILSYLLGRPVIALTYDPKIDAVMRRYGQSEFCLDLETTRPALLRSKVDAMLADLPRIRARVRAQLAADREGLERQYDALYGPAARRAPAPVLTEVVA